MCCYRVDTEVLLANLFANSKNYPTSYSMREVKEYLSFLAENFPTYIVTNLSEKAIVDCSFGYPKLYSISKDNGEIIINSGNDRPNLNYFNSIYSQNIRNYITSLTNIFLDMIKHEVHEPVVAI